MRPTLSPEAADFVAYLEQRMENADTMIGQYPEFAEHAADRKRQLAVIRDDVKAGLHLGAREVRAQMLAGPEVVS